MRRTGILCSGVALLLVVGLAPPAMADVLIVGSPARPEWQDDVVAKVLASGRGLGAVDKFDSGSGTPTLQQLQQYEAVLVYTDRNAVDPVALGNVMADYCDAGGGVVQCTFSWSSSIPLDGRWRSGGYAPLTYVGQAQNVELFLGTRHDPGHPALQDVASFSGGSASFHNNSELAPNAAGIADWTNGTPLIAEMGGFAGLILGLNFYPPSSDARQDFWRAGTDGDLLLGNALLYVSGGGGCVYTIKKSRAKRGCEDCPAVGDSLPTQAECEVVKDCDKKIKTIIACPGGQNGTCKLKGKRQSCGA